MNDFIDKETGFRRGPTKAESIGADTRHSYNNPGASFDYYGWDVSWVGWRSPVDAIYEFGVWIARKIHNGRVDTTMYATTLGRVGFVGMDGTFDVSPMVGPASFGQQIIRQASMMSEKDRTDMTYVAVMALLKFIDQTDDASRQRTSTGD